MNNEAQVQTTDIKDLILTVRGTQVLLDSDVAMLYGYETRAINQTASRNKDRFPGSFRFQLTREEFDGIEAIRVQSVVKGPLLENYQNLISQTVISSSKGYGGRRKLPYVYAEEGIAMLSGLLKNDTAVQVSIGISTSSSSTNSIQR